MAGGYNCVVLLGPTAVGKTALGVQIARHYGWDIISADSRQVYKGLDLGSGKDLADYTLHETLPDGSVRDVQIPYHLIDVTTLDDEYNVFSFQRDFYALFRSCAARHAMPFVVGGTGMYLDAIIRGYNFVPVPENAGLRQQLAGKSMEELGALLLALRPNLHNKSDLRDRERLIRAIEIQTFMQGEAYRQQRVQEPLRPEVQAFVLGTTIPRDILRENIARRLKERMDAGMVDEVRSLHDAGYSWERLEKLGLEYRFVSEYLEGKIGSVEDLSGQLCHAICQFAKRQETWFRGMERKGVIIHWLPPVTDRETRYDAALRLIDRALEP